MRRLAFFAAALFVTASCRTAAPILSPLPADDPRPALLLEAWARTAGERNAVRGRARLAVDGGDGRLRLRGRQVLVAERPARLRVEIQGLLNQTVAVLVTDGERFELFRADDRSYQSGPVEPDLLWRHAWLALTPQQAIDVLLGAPTPDPTLTPAAARGDADGGVRLELADASGRVRRLASFDSEGRLRRLEVLDSGGELAWRAEFDDYAAVDGEPFAHAVSLDVAAGATHAEIELSDVELNPALAPDIFRLRAPAAGAAVDQGG